MSRIVKFISPGLIPLFLGIAFLAFCLLYDFLDLPPPVDIAKVLKEYFDQFGGATILFAAFVEGIFMVNIYFPGSFVIVLAVILADKTFPTLGAIALLTWIGFIVASFVNYFLGKFGFYKPLLILGKKDAIDKTKLWMEKRGAHATFWAAFHPNFLAFVVVTMGVVRVSLHDCLVKTGKALAFWVIFWTGLTASLATHINIEDSNQGWYVVGILFVLAFLLMIKEYFFPAEKYS